jgi:hypothetical protein
MGLTAFDGSAARARGSWICAMAACADKLNIIRKMIVSLIFVTSFSMNKGVSLLP